MFDLYSMEADNDEINIDFKETTNDETAVDDAGSDSVTTDVSNISEEKTDHNEEASAGGVATGSNEDDIAVDPVVATESYLWKEFGISSEDVDRNVAEVVQEAEQIPDADPNGKDDYDENGMLKDPDLEAVGVYNGGAVANADDLANSEDNDPLKTEDQPVNMDDGEDDNDAPNIDASEESFVNYSLSQEGFKVLGMPNVKTVDEYFKLDYVKSSVQKLKDMMTEKNLVSLKTTQLGQNQKKFLSQKLPSSSQLAKMKERGIDFTISDKSSNGVNFILCRCKIDNSDVASVFVALKKKDSNKYSLKLFGDMNLSKMDKSKESLLFNMFM
jgi:hypothetical protein